MSIASDQRPNTFLGAPSTLLDDYLRRVAGRLVRRRQILGDQIRAARKAKHWKQKDLARRMQVDPQTISHWERGANMPDWDKIEMLARELGQPLSYFVSDDGEMIEQEAVLRELAEMRHSLARIETLLRAALDQPRGEPGSASALPPAREAP